MKFSLFFVCCFISTMHYSVEGGLVKEFFGKVKETAGVIHKDVHDIWRGGTDKNNSESTVTTSTPTTSAAKVEHDDKENKKEEHKVDGNKEDSKVPEIGTTASPTATKEHEVKEDNHEETTTAATSTTTEKDGRANFAGACQTGYRRTADGRCMSVE